MDNNFNPFDEKPKTNEPISDNQTDESLPKEYNHIEPQHEVNAESQTIVTDQNDLTANVPIESESVPIDNALIDANNNYEIPSTPPINESANYYINNQGYNAAKGKKNNSGKGATVLIIIIATLCILGVISAGIWGAFEIYKDSDSNELQQNSSSSNSPNDYILKGDIPTSGPLTVSQIFAKLQPSVVTIIGDDRTLSSGIVMKENGYILTNAHVVEGGASFKIITSTGKEYTDVEVVGSDTQSDLAVLKIKTDDVFTAATFGKSSDLVVGQSVVAIGNPFSVDLSYTCTTGIISGIRTNLTLGDFTSNLIQTNAQINPGNSGGPLIDEYGRVIGIVNIKIMNTSSGNSEGLGFAIPMDVAVPIAETLIKDGYISKPMLGITGYFIDSVTAQMNSLPIGILIDSTATGSDVATQGIKKGDVITKINDTAFKSMSEFNSIKAKFKIGESVKLTIYSNNGYREVNAKLVDSKGK